MFRIFQGIWGAGRSREFVGGGGLGTLILGGPICKGVNSGGGALLAGNHAGVTPALL